MKFYKCELITLFTDYVLRSLAINNGNIFTKPFFGDGRWYRLSPSR